MNLETNIFGCFVSGPSVNWDDDQETKDAAAAQGQLFRTYIWGENGISKILKKLNKSDYGKDLVIILFQFYLNPIPYELTNLKEIESYRKKEKSIGIPIIVNNENFFSTTEDERQLFLRQSVFEKLCLLKDTVKKKNLDTNMEKLTNDVESLFMIQIEI